MKPFPQMLGLRIGAIKADAGDDRGIDRRDDGALDVPRTVDRALIQHRSTYLQRWLQSSGETQMNSCPLPSKGGEPGESVTRIFYATDDKRTFLYAPGPSNLKRGSAKLLPDSDFLSAIPEFDCATADFGTLSVRPRSA